MIFNYTLEDLARAIAGLEEHEQNAIIGNNLINMQYLLKLMNDDGTCKDTIEKLDEGIEQLNNTIEQYPLVVLGTAVTAGVMIWQKYKQSVIDIKEAGETARSEFKSIQDEMNSTASKVNEVKDRYAELAQGVGDLGKATQNQGSLSNDDYEEFLNISNDLADLFPTLTNGYTDNGDAILDLNGDVQTITSSLNGLVEAQKAVAAQDMAKQMPDIFKSYRQDMNDDVKKYNEALEQQKKAQEAIAKLDDSNTGESYITYFDDLSEMMQKHQIRDLKLLSSQRIMNLLISEML